MIKDFSYKPANVVDNIGSLDLGNYSTNNNDLNNNIAASALEMDFDNFNEGLQVTESSPSQEQPPVTAEDLQKIQGELSQDEYDAFVKGIEDYYQKEADYIDNVLNGEDGINKKLDEVNDAKRVIDNLITTDSSVSSIYMQTSVMNPRDEILKSMPELLEKAGVSSYEELVSLQKELTETKNTLTQELMKAKNFKDSAKYDYLSYLKDYADFTGNEITQAQIDELKNYKNPESLHWEDNYGSIRDVYNYRDYVKDHPGITPVEFVMMIEQSNPPKDYSVEGVDDLEYLQTMAKIADKHPEVSEKYSYLYTQDPESAKQYLKDIKYQLNNYKGELDAAEFLATLAEAGDDEDALDEVIYNEFGVHIKGLEDGLESFGMGLYHTGEALLDIENRTMSASEYETIYIMQALASKKAKIELGLINEDGTLADQKSIIDYSKEYTGPLLSNNYEFSQGVGNMLPSVAISLLNPTAGSVLLGVSAGGNAYHGAMVEGKSLESAVFYGIFTGSSEAITERLLGGLPGLSNTQVTGIKSYLTAMAKEGSQEMLQGFMDELYQEILMGKEIPDTPEEWDAWLLDLGKQGLYGALTAGYMQIPSVYTFTTDLRRANNMLNEINVSPDELSAALSALRGIDETLSNTDDNVIKARYTDLLMTKIKIGRLKANYNCNPETVEILDSIATSKQLELLESKINAGANIDEASLEVLIQMVKNDEYSIKDLNEFLKKYVENGSISDETINRIFTDLVGEKLSSWVLKPEIAKRLLMNLTDAGARANLKYSQLGKSIELMEAMEDYYDQARDIELETNRDMLETYRTHGIVHIFDVLTQSINSYTAMANTDCKLPKMDLDTIMLTAALHDTGMSGGDQVHLKVVDGKLKIEIKDVQKDANNVRESHSFNSGDIILREAQAIMEAGFSDTQVAEAALLAFAHSKSNSGLNPLLNNEAGWSFAIQALQAANIKYAKENNIEPFDFLKVLKKAKIIQSTKTTSIADAKAKCPKVYVEDENGNRVFVDIKKVMQDEKGYYQINKTETEYYDETGKKRIKVTKEKVYIENIEDHIVHRDEDGTYYKLDENGNKVPFEGEIQAIEIAGAGGKKTGTVDVFSFEPGVIEKLSYEALAVRLGDALTNNDNGLVNQFYDEITIDNDAFKHQYNAEQVLEAMRKDFIIAETSGDIPEVPTTDDIVEMLLKMEDGLRDAAFKESLHGENDSVTYKINGIEQNRSQPFILGEHNQTYEVRTSKDGKGIDVVVKIRDSSHVPFATLFAIEERAGELKSIASPKAGYKKQDGNMKINLLIDIGENTPPDIKALYQQYIDAYKENPTITVDFGK